MKVGQFVAQGDIMIIKVSDCVDAPLGATPIKSTVPGRTVLAYGKVTGHHHSVDESVAKLFTASGIGNLPKVGPYRASDKDDAVMVIDAPCAVEHQEHAPFDLTPGQYVVRRQVTLEAGDIKRVLD